MKFFEINISPIFDGSLLSGVAVGSTFVTLAFFAIYFPIARWTTKKNADKVWKQASLLAEVCAAVGLVGAVGLFSSVMSRVEIKEKYQQLQAYQESFKRVLTSGMQTYCGVSSSANPHDQDVGELCMLLKKTISASVQCTDVSFLFYEMSPAPVLKTDVFKELRHEIYPAILKRTDICQTEAELQVLKAEPIVTELNKSPFGYLLIAVVAGIGVVIKISRAVREVSKDARKYTFKLIRKRLSVRKKAMERKQRMKPHMSGP